MIGPGYEMALALAGFGVRDLFLAAELLSVAATLATLMLWFYLLKAPRRGAGGRGRGSLARRQSAFFRHGYGALTDAPAIALQAAALYFLLAGGPSARCWSRRACWPRSRSSPVTTPSICFRRG